MEYREGGVEEGESYGNRSDTYVLWFQPATEIYGEVVA